MKKVYLPILFLLFALMANAQTFKVMELEPESEIANNDTVYVVGTPDEFQLAKHLDIENLTATALNMHILTEDIQMPDGMNSAFCLNVCYPPTTTEIDFSINGSSNQTLDIDLMTAGNEGVAVVKVTLNNVDNDDMISFYVQFTVDATGLFESNAKELIAYPNPVTSTMNVNFNGSTNPDTKVNVYDAVGKLVISQPINNATNYQLNFSDLPRGIYLLKLLDNSNVIQTKKIIKK
jgi:hypothetical protein